MKHKRLKVTCKYCGKPFFIKFPYESINLNYKGCNKIQVIRETTTGTRFHKVYDGIACSNRCARLTKVGGYRVLNHQVVYDKYLKYIEEVY